MKKKLLCIILSVCMIVPAFSGISTYATGVEEIETNTNDPADPMSQVPAENAYEKIHFYFDTAEHANLESVSELATATASVKTDYATTLGVAQRRSTDADVNENVYITVQFVSDYMEDETYKTLKAARENAKTADERDEAKTRMNQYSKQYHADLVAENLPTLSAIPYTAFHAIDYSSFVTLTVPAAELDTAVLEEVADQDNILHISLTDGFEYVADSYLDSTTLQGINAYSIVTNGTYTGEDIKIGIYEALTFEVKSGSNTINVANNLDTTHENFSNLSNDITIRPGDTGPCSTLTHATKVTSILALMVPDAQLYFAKCHDIQTCSPEGLAYFISQGCDIVNVSFGMNSTGYRNDCDGLYDYHSYYNRIVVVKSAGNKLPEATTYISSPGYAYNVITVGGVEYSSSDNGWIYCSKSRYQTPNYVIKPTIAAPYYVSIPNIGEVEGTSYSAPLVTSCIALLKDKYSATSTYWLNPQRIMAVLTSTATRTADYCESILDDEYIDCAVGAGVVNLGRMLNNYGYVHTTISSGTLYSEVISQTVAVAAGIEIQVSVAWQVTANSSGTPSCTDYDLYIYDSEGDIVAMSLKIKSNFELIRYTVPEMGVYRLVVKQNSARNQSDRIALSYNCY